jgi:hypothetical protein
MFVVVSSRCRKRLFKPCLSIRRFSLLPEVRLGYCHGYCQNHRSYPRCKHSDRQVEPHLRRASTGFGELLGLSDHLETRSPSQQGRHEAPEIRGYKQKQGP